MVSPITFQVKLLDEHLLILLCEEFFKREGDQAWLNSKTQIETLFIEFEKWREKTLPLEKICNIAAHYFWAFSRKGLFPKNNLKIALAMCLTFLRINKILIQVKEMSLFQMALDTGHREASLQEFSEFLLDHVSCNIPTNVEFTS